MSTLFFLWFFAVLTTSLLSQAIKAPEGARALFIAAAEVCEFFCALAWRARLRIGAGAGLCACASSYLPLEGLVRCDGVKVEPCVYRST